ncbi:hypothetical protein JB92DRAFT_2210835 [Gautieria morchelliformis]|nr:hypothetical protein JB92DRAFT_2210835 [Gautieria morchelliformis]
MSQASALISALSQLQKTNLSTAAATAWLTYEILITLGQEINYIWKAQWSPPKVLYLASRYYGLFNLVVNTFVTLTPNLSVNLCVITTFASGATPIIPPTGVQLGVGLTHCNFCKEMTTSLYANTGYSSGAVFFTTTVNLILLLRIHALYGRNKTVLIVLLTLYCGEFVTEVIITALTVRQIHFIPIPPNVPLLGCLSADHPPGLTLIAWVPCLTIACVFFLMTLYKFYTFLRQEFSSDSGVRFPRKGRSLAPVTSLFLRDGALFFAMMFAVILLNTLFNVIAKSGPLLAVGSPWVMATYSLAGPRLILNLRSASGRVDIMTGSHMVLTESVSQRDPVFARAGQDSAPSTVTTTA